MVELIDSLYFGQFIAVFIHTIFVSFVISNINFLCQHGANSFIKFFIFSFIFEQQWMIYSKSIKAIDTNTNREKAREKELKHHQRLSPSYTAFGIQ